MTKKCPSQLGLRRKNVIQSDRHTGAQLYFKPSFGTQGFHVNRVEISQETVQFHRKNAENKKKTRIPKGP